PRAADAIQRHELIFPDLVNCSGFCEPSAMLSPMPKHVAGPSEKICRRSERFRLTADDHFVLVPQPPGRETDGAIVGVENPLPKVAGRMPGFLMQLADQESPA